MQLRLSTASHSREGIASNQKQLQNLILVFILSLREHSTETLQTALSLLLSSVTAVAPRPPSLHAAVHS